MNLEFFDIFFPHSIFWRASIPSHFWDKEPVHSSLYLLTASNDFGRIYPYVTKAQPLSKVYEKVILGWLFIIVSQLFSCYNSTIKNSSVDLLRGPILRSLLIFALPTLVSNIFQQLYNTADVMIVGRFIGPDAWAAVGASSSIFDLVIGICPWCWKMVWGLLLHVIMVHKNMISFVNL